MISPAPTEKQISRFWSSVAKTDTCWEWQKYCNPNGYGITSFATKLYAAHRVAYFLTTGIDPGELFCCHTCDNPKCCNPSHIFLGTQKDNMRDMATKGRNVMPRGSAHAKSKVTEDQVREIRRRHATGERCTDLAREFGMSKTALMYIYQRKSYPDVE